MSTAPSHPPSVFNLVTLALLPLPFLGLLALLRGERDLSLVHYAGLLAFVVIAARMAYLGGAGRRRCGFALVGTSFLSLLLVNLSTIFWVGFREVAVTVRVVDADTGRPVPDASVSLGDESEKDASRATTGTTDTKGQARLERRFMMSGSATWVGIRGGLYLWDTLRVEAAGYWGVRGRLSEYTADGWDAYGPPLPPVEVRLKRAGEGPPP
jgi:hypothetical protein